VVWTLCLKLTRQVPYHLSHELSPFLFLAVFQIGSCILPHYQPLRPTSDQTVTPYLIDWDGGLTNFLPGLASNHSLPKSLPFYKCTYTFLYLLMFFISISQVLQMSTLFLTEAYILLESNDRLTSTDMSKDLQINWTESGKERVWNTTTKKKSIYKSRLRMGRV
jgi:hypothetical protein